MLNLPKHDDETLARMADAWASMLHEIPEEQIDSWFREAMKLLAHYPERGRRLTAVDVWYCFDADRKGLRKTNLE